MLMKTSKLCYDAGCAVCSSIHDLLTKPFVIQFMNQASFKQDKFDVDATLSDAIAGWTATSIEEFQLEPNMCFNHVTGIPAANYSQAKCFKSQEVYDFVHDYVVRISRIGIEVIAAKAHFALPRYLIEEHEDELGACLL